MKKIRFIVSKMTAALMALQMLSPISTNVFASEIKLSPTEKSALVKKYAPKVYFHKDEEFFPGTVEDWFNGTEMRYLTEDTRKYISGQVGYAGGIKFIRFLDTHITSENITEFYYNGEKSNASRKFYLERIDDSVQYGDNDGDVNAPVYVKYYEGNQYDEITYLFWYPHNGNIGPDFPDAASHQGDWERIMVVVDKATKSIHSAKYNAHGAEHEWYRADELNYDGTHPIVYSAHNSHASYSLLSATSTGNNQWKIDRPAGTALLLPDDHISNNGQTWETWENIVKLSDENWLNFGGKWGAYSVEYKDGPSGPGAEFASDLNSGKNKIVFYQRDNCIGNMRAMWSIEGDKTYKITEDAPSGTNKLANDAMRSLKLLKVDKGTLIRLYDNPDGSKSDDYVDIYVKRNSNFIRINNLENFVDNSDVCVMPHLMNGLSGKISRVEVKKNQTIPKQIAAFYEGNNISQDLVGTINLSNDSSINLQNDIMSNDEIRSMKISNALQNTVITVFDSPSGSKDDDWTQVYIKKDINEIVINSFENYEDTDSYTIIPHRKNGIDGKISRISVDIDSSFKLNGVVELYEGNNGSQDNIGTLDVQYTRINFKKHKIDNDEARSMKLKSVIPGTIIRVFDNPDGKWNDDVCTIEVKKFIESYTVNTFQKSYEDQYVKVSYHKKNGLDGKVSRIEIN